MRYKVQWFEENKKPYVSMYSKEYDRENPEAYINLLKTRLIEKLKVIKNEEYIFTPRSYDEIIEVAWGLYKDPIPQNIINFINIAKTYGFKPNDVDDILSKGDWSLKQRAFGKLALSVYRIYQEELEKSGMIDFGDMINRAIDEMQKNPQLYSGVYDHVLIDEYQDISLQRFRLIEELLRRNPNCKLFCVGDDWQSIMSFAGSDVQFFINFKDYFSSPSVSEISTNYRSIKTIVDAGAQVIQNNRENQISKTTKAKNNVEKRIKIFVLNHQKVYEKNYLKQIAEDCVNRIDDYLKDYSEYAPHDILVLSRFRKHPIVRHFKEYAQEKGIKVASEKQASRDEVRILTVHKSKGLQAKVVFILNVVKGPYGFPCTLQDPSIYEPIRKDSPKQDRLQEERRLFYVALTRAKEDVIIYTWGNARSEFLKEIEGYTEEELLPYWKTRDESPPK
jgi:DNA helicase-4